MTWRWRLLLIGSLSVGIGVQVVAPPYGLIAVMVIAVLVLGGCLAHSLWRAVMPGRYPAVPFREGGRARRNGMSERANPYPAGTSEHGGWEAGWGRP